MSSPNPVLTVVHQETSTPGLIGTKLSELGYSIDLRCPALGDSLPEHLDQHSAALVFGGPMSANDETEPFIRKELDWISQVLTAGKPYLGVCLGAQMLARVLGATVDHHPKAHREIGYHPIYATAAGQDLFPPELYVYQWHQEGFEIPASATLLAKGDAFPNQAFRYGSQAYGVQFHPEITADMIDFWTGKAPEQLVLAGAQPRDLHFKYHQQHGAAVERWLEPFLQTWLSA
ncbi:glutamine amidotransferase [Romeria aff. gracilis LEGE 07310]|uniref:Glutamine amidotransferase n=1 Tax=Vasconcelosia minhoensis LEGE 07310 TaxID=915328 RepID=A0A8J7ALE0_9CYAN|nr:glutamine amidotransferase [Romeria gracilis]MBE9079993.1 glutamine amidotransferase [Romeria aff. gracilis LEGE 07310]